MVMLPYFIWLAIGVVIGCVGDWLYESHLQSRKRIAKDAAASGSQIISYDNASLGALQGGHLESSALEKKLWAEEELTLLFDVSEKISLSRDKSKIAKEMVETICNFLTTRIGALFLIDKAENSLKIKYSQGLPLEIIEACVLKKNESVSGIAWSRNELIVSQDLQSDAWLKGENREPYLQHGVIAMPLAVEGNVLGVLTVADRKAKGPFLKEDLIFVANVTRIAAIALHNLELYDQVEKSYLDTITTLALTLDARDPYTKMHSENVTFYALAIAQEIGLRAAEKDLMRYAGLLHDIGKIGIRDEILLKPGKLSPEEFQQIKLHPLKGEALVKPLSFLKEVPSIIRHHHERYDGKGYPDGLSGERIELSARVLSVADTFDAMTTDRPYRKALCLEEAVNELIQSKATQLDPNVVDCFLRVIKSNPQIALRLNSSSTMTNHP